MACEEIICKKIEIKSDQAQQSLAAVDKSSQKVTKSTKDLDSQLAVMPGILGKVRAGVAKLGKAFKALLANPIVALIALITISLIAMGKAFTKTQEGADKMKDAMAGVRAVIDVLIGRLARLFKALSLIVKGDFRDGWEEMKLAVSDVKEEIIAATKGAIAFEQAQRQLLITTAEINKANAIRRGQIAELVFLTRDQTKSIEERREAVIQADAIEKKILSENIKLQKERVRLAEEEIALDPENFMNRELALKLLEEETKLVDLNTESLGRQRELKNRLNELDAQAAAQRKIEAEARRTEAEEQRTIEEQFAKDQAEFEDEIAEQQVADEKALTDKLIKESERRFSREEELTKRQEENEKLLANVKESIYQDSLDALFGFLKEGSKVAKAVAIADATKSAIQSAIAAYSSAAAIPVVGFVLGPIAAAAALAAGMANVRKIVNTPDPFGNTGTVPSVSLATPTEVSPDLSDPGIGAPTDVNIIQDQTVRDGAVKAFVVQSDITAAQEIAVQREADVTL